MSAGERLCRLARRRFVTARLLLRGFLCEIFPQLLGGRSENDYLTPPDEVAGIFLNSLTFHHALRLTLSDLAPKPKETFNVSSRDRSHSTMQVEQSQVAGNSACKHRLLSKSTLM